MKKLNLLLTTLLLLVIMSCDKDTIDGTGPIVTETLDVDLFEKVDFQIVGSVTIRQGQIQEVTVTGQANIIQDIETEVSNDTWEISLAKDRYSYDQLDIIITLPTIKAVTLRGSGDITIEDFSQASNLQLTIEGSGNMDLQRIDVPSNVDVEIEGSGSINVLAQSPALENLGITITGSGNFFGYNMPSANCEVNIYGSGDTEVQVAQSLSVNIEASGSVFYKGSPTVTQSITGSGKVVNTN